MTQQSAFRTVVRAPASTWVSMAQRGRPLGRRTARARIALHLLDPSGGHASGQRRPMEAGERRLRSGEIVESREYMQRSGAERSGACKNGDAGGRANANNKETAI